MSRWVGLVVLVCINWRAFLDRWVVLWIKDIWVRDTWVRQWDLDKIHMGKTVGSR